MGIMNGARLILAHMPVGLYARAPKSYNVYVDGELIRYKGMVTENLTKSDAELAIARTSYLYLRRLLESVERHLGKRADRTIVYMDGARVANKVADRPEFLYDASLIRSTFSAYCLDNGIEMRHLEYGESELQMYLMRDTRSELNVFVTADSDTLTIMYHHRAASITDAVAAAATTTTTPNAVATAAATTSNEEQRIQDRNKTHEQSVRDSCLWINCSSSGIMAYGMDNLRDRIGYEPFQFRVFLSLCGTDFTPQLYTDSIVSGIMTASREDREFINSLNDVNELAAMFLLLGLRGDGTIKRKEVYNYEQLDSHEIMSWLENLDKLVRNYIAYAETGRMDPDPVPKPKMSILCRFYLFVMRNGVDNYVRKNIQVWAKSERLERALSNYRRLIRHEAAKTTTDSQQQHKSHFAQSLRLSENRSAATRRQRVRQMMTRTTTTEEEEEEGGSSRKRAATTDNEQITQIVW